MSRRAVSAWTFGAACAFAGGLFLLLPWGWAQEEGVGLQWLFLARGPRPAPSEVVVVAIDRASSERLSVAFDTEEWPRNLHARLVEGLHRAGAGSVVFDLLFREDRGDSDKPLVEAIEAAGNVALLEFLEKREVSVAGPGAGQLNAAVHRRVLPAPHIAAAALTTGPFTLPKVPLRVAQFWTFDRNAGDAPSLPLVTLLVYALPAYETLREAVATVAPELAMALPASVEELTAANALPQVAATLASALRGQPRLAEAILARVGSVPDGVSTRSARALSSALLSALADPPSRYLNFYGPPLTVRTISYEAALRDLSQPTANERWADRAVFVGLSSPVQWEQQDEFITAFSDPKTGHDLSGIEILATAFANLLDRNSLEPLPPVFGLALVLGWGFVIGLLSRLLTPAWATAVVLSLGALFLFMALHLFDGSQIWLPVVTPLAVQVPFALFFATTIHYFEAKRDRSRIREIFRYYLPEPVVERLVREGFHPTQDRERVFGVCLYSDAEQYTTLSEGMDPNELAAFMNAYYEVIFEPVRSRDGIISDVVGDAMMAIWAARRDDLAIRKAACRAALEIFDALERRNASREGPLLPTRIGVHCGAMALAHVGARDHFEYRAVGDIVNTASRLQNLNKALNTRLLVSAEMLQGVDEAVARPLGSFTLPGKHTPIEVYELVEWEASPTVRD